jgi:hypothetical protein
VHSDLHDLQPAGEFVPESFGDWGDHTPERAPGCPEIEQHRDRAGELIVQALGVSIDDPGQRPAAGGAERHPFCDRAHAVLLPAPPARDRVCPSHTGVRVCGLGIGVSPSAGCNPPAPGVRCRGIGRGSRARALASSSLSRLPACSALTSIRRGLKPAVISPLLRHDLAFSTTWTGRPSAVGGDANACITSTQVATTIPTGGSRCATSPKQVASEPDQPV